MKPIPDDDFKRAMLIAGAVLLLLACLSGHAAAYVYDFQDTDDLDDWDDNGASYSILQVPYAETNVLCISTDVAAQKYVAHNVSYPTNYWAFTRMAGTNLYFGLMDQSFTKVLPNQFNLITSATGDRLEFIRGPSLHVFVYRNGVYSQDLGECTDIPYYMYLGGLAYLDDIVIGTSEERNVISCPPQTWFVAKDLFDSGFSGLYDVVDHQVYSSEMHCNYATDDGSATVITEHIGTGAVVNTTTVSGYAGTITYNLTNMLFNSGAAYGQYRVWISGSSTIDTFWYKAIATSGTSIQWDDNEYENGDTATVTFSIGEAYWDTDDYTYRLEIWDESLNEVTGWAITSRPVAATKTETIDSPDYSEGTYYAVLTASDTSSGEEVLMCYDTCTVDMPGTGEVFVTGVTYDATTNASLVSCTVTATQLGADHSTTSDAGTGAYEFTSGLVTDWSLGLNASKTAYTGYLIAFTPYEEGTYTVDLPLVPSGGPEPGDASNTTTSYYNSTVDGTAIGGICWEGPYWTLCDGCNVTVSNSTWSCTTQTGAGGWYQCNNIGCGGTYTLTASCEGCSNYTKSCSLSEGCFNREDCTLESSTDLNVQCRELTSGALITGTTCTVSLSTGESCDTTNGTAVFSGLAYGYYEIEASAEGYYPGSTSVVMDEGKTVTCYLQSQSERTGGSGISYAPHPVRFSFRDQSSNPLDGMTITATPLECTGPWTWLTEWLGLNQTAVDIQGTTLSGTTGDDGSWTAWMIETVRYRMNVVDATRGINTTWTLYPKQDEYAYDIDLEPDVPEFEGNIEWNVSVIDVNATHMYLHCSYSDLLDHTDSCDISVMNSTGGVIYTQSCSPANNCSVNYTVENIKGNAYTWGFTAEHTDFGTITNYKGITLEGTGGRLVDLGLDDFWYDMISLGALFMVALFFSSKMNPHGAITLALTGGILWFIGWLNISYLFVACAIVIAILIYVEKKEERSPV